MSKIWEHRIEGILIGIGLSLLTIMLTSCAPKKVQLYSPTTRPGYAFYQDDKGYVLILKDSSQYKQALDDLCKVPCSVESAGEMFILTTLDKGKKK